LLASIALTGLAAGSASALSIEPASTFQSTGSEVTWSTSAGNIYACKGGSSTTGQFTSGTSGQMTLKMQGCGSSFTTCTSPGQASGTIVTSTLGVKPVYLDAARTLHGLLLSPPASGVFAEFSCSGVPRVWTGSLLGRITSPALGVKSTQHTLSFTESSAGQQTYQRVEGALFPLYRLKQGEATVAVTATQPLTFPIEVKFAP